MIAWVETMTEAYFLHKTVFTAASTEADDEEYMQQLLDKISHQVDQVSSTVKQMSELEGMIDQFVESADITKIKLKH